jgi:hypothetical protein
MKYVPEVLTSLVCRIRLPGANLFYGYIRSNSGYRGVARGGSRRPLDPSRPLRSRRTLWSRLVPCNPALRRIAGRGTGYDSNRACGVVDAGIVCRRWYLGCGLLGNQGQNTAGKQKGDIDVNSNSKHRTSLTRVCWFSWKSRRCFAVKITKRTREDDTEALRVRGAAPTMPVGRLICALAAIASKVRVITMHRRTERKVRVVRITGRPHSRSFFPVRLELCAI